MDGWIKIHRKIREHWLWSDPIKLKWWLDLLLRANYSKTKVNVGMLLFDCDRGEIVTSLARLASDWNVSKDTARNFLKLLEKDGMIRHDNLTKATRIIICNYNSYQFDKEQGSNAKDSNIKSNTDSTRINNGISSNCYNGLHDKQTQSERSIYIKENKKNNTLSQYARGIENLSLEDCFNILSGNNSWKEAVTMNTCCDGYADFTLDKFDRYLLSFFRKLQNEGETEKSVKDAMSHFARWLKLELEHDKNNRTNRTSKEDANNEAMQQFLDYYHKAHNSDSGLSN